MAYYAFLNEDNVVTSVIAGRNETETVNGISDWEKYYGQRRNQKCLRTSFNGRIRKNFAGVGFSYDSKLDAFIAPKPFDSWTLDSEAKWQAPKPYPTDKKAYSWNEKTLSWDLIA